MNANQKNLLIVVLAAVVVALVFPPFQLRLYNGFVRTLGYGFLFDPPTLGLLVGHVDIGLLVTEWVGILIIGGIAFFLLGGIKTMPQDTPTEASQLASSRTQIGDKLSGAQLNAGKPTAPKVSDQRSLYEVIGVRPTATRQEIERACLALGEKVRPDNTPLGRLRQFQFAEIERAYETLTDPEKRARYDQTLRAMYDAMPTAGPWRRFFARYFDLLWETLILDLLAVSSFPSITQQLSDFSDLFFYLIFIGGVEVFVSLFLDAAILAVTGSTPGKWLMGVRVRRADGSRLSFADAANRNLGMWFYGLGASIPLVTLFTLHFSRRRLLKKQRTRWDERGDYIVIREGTGPLRTIGSAITFVFLLLVFGNAQQAYRNHWNSVVTPAPVSDSDWNSVTTPVPTKSGVPRSESDWNSVGTPAPETPAQSLPELSSWLHQARPLNPGVSDAELTTYWNNTYGKQAALARSLDDASAAYKGGDYTTALRLWRPLADQGNADAQSSLGFLYANGQGVPQDYVEALKWCRLAANQGNTLAYNNLGMMYQRGDGVAQNYVEALKWFNLAAAGGLKEAATSRSILEGYMTREQIAEAQRRAAAWKPAR